MAKEKAVSSKSKNKALPKKQAITWAPGMPFTKINYIIMLIGIVVLMIGYILLSGGGTEDPTEFSEAIFDFRRMYAGPIMLTIGFLIELFAIMYRQKEKKEKKEKKELL